MGPIKTRRRLSNLALLSLLAPWLHCRDDVPGQLIAVRRLASPPLCPVDSS